MFTRQQILFVLFVFVIIQNIFSTDIFQACNEGDIETVTKIIESGEININSIDEQGNSLIHCVISKGLYEMDSKEINRRNEIIKYLLSKGADINIKNSDGESPLYYALYYDYFNYNFLKILLDNSVDFSSEYNSDNDNSVIYILSDKHEYFNSEIVNIIEIFELLISYNKFDANFIDDMGNNLILKAVSTVDNNLLDLLELLLKQNVDINLLNKDKNNALMIAVSNKNFEAVKYLVDNNIDIYIKNKDGKSILKEMISFWRDGYYYIFKYLVEKGADISDIYEDSFFSVFNIANNAISMDIALLFRYLCKYDAFKNEVEKNIFNDLKYSSNDEKMKFYIIYGDIDSIIKLLNDGVNPSKIRNDGPYGSETPSCIEYAIMVDDVNILNIFHKNGYILNKRDYINFAQKYEAVNCMKFLKKL